MDDKALRELLEAVRVGKVSIDGAATELARLPFTDLGVAKVDHHRMLRQGAPEIIFGERKTASEIIAITNSLIASGENVLITRLVPDVAEEIRAALPALIYNARAKTGRIAVREIVRRDVGRVAIVTAGTSDIGVAEEAAETLDLLGLPVDRHFDVGVAGIHRLLHRLDDLRRAACVICIAGMEGALPSVVGGLVSCPVVAVPTSVGYGTAMGGITPLFAMLTSCANGLAVVNIDSGFGAAMVVHRILRSRTVEPAEK